MLVVMQGKLQCLRFEPCLDQLGLLLILCRININQININPNIRSSHRLL